MFIFLTAILSGTTHDGQRSTDLHHSGSQNSDSHPYTGVTMECVSEFNWNQGQGGVFRSASPFFVGHGGNISWRGQTSRCRGWSAEGTTLTMYGTYQPRLFFKSAHDEVLMIDMTKDAISWTQDVSQLGRTFNGALYTSWVAHAHRDDAPPAAKYYCDRRRP